MKKVNGLLLITGLIALFVAAAVQDSQASNKLFTTSGAGPNPRTDSNDYFITRLGAIGGPLVEVETGASSGTLYDQVAADNDRRLGSGFASQVRPGGGATIAHRLLISPAHFGLTAQEYIGWLYEGGGMELIQSIVDDFAKENGYSVGGAAVGPNEAKGPVIVLPVHFAPPEATGWFPFEVADSVAQFQLDIINNLADDVLDMRLLGYERDVMEEAIGAAFVNFPPAIPGVATIQQLCDGGFDAIEFAAPNEDAIALFLQGNKNPISCGAPHYYMGTWHNQVNLVTLLINKDWFENLTAEDQERIVSAAKETSIQALAKGYNESAEALGLFAKKGAIIHKSLPAAILQALRDAEEVIQAEFAAEDKNFKRMLDAIKDWAMARSPYLTNGAAQPDERFNLIAGWESDINTVD